MGSEESGANPASTATWRCAAGAVPPGQTARFQLQRDGRAVAAFIVNLGDRHVAYVNRCPHAGTPLDLWPNEFLSADGRNLICATHGAVFEPDSGRCIEGPCPGAHLEALLVETDGESVLVRCRP